MKRSVARESAFLIVFERIFNNADLNEVVESAQQIRGLEVDDFTVKLVRGVADNLDKIDDLIQQNAKGWDISRLSKVVLVALRVAIYEMIFIESIPIRVSINEAVELTKKYSTKEDSSFANGILREIAKGLSTESE